MRMWMLDPACMCRRHLLGEHVELHMLAGSLARGRSLDGHLSRGQLAPQHARTRHDALAAEMTRRGYHHRSPLPDLPEDLPVGHVCLERSRADLMERCPECGSLMTVTATATGADR